MKTRIYYVCFCGTTKRPEKIEIDRELKEGDRFEFWSLDVEVINVYHGKGGTQLEVTEV